ncbi:phenylacetate--CoA ligase family protein [Desulfonatronovibrio hydrogenovorans]|uniref:phenylacetate--CoA ligase family protein n=1 Tax=Desulfonatronovibrio hydrogenovorans TaxID=53245 RepID=UPI00048FE51B|nr:phenylacetate--CoA ligase [Desulfonatronovibrio hydrogenovorans]
MYFDPKYECMNREDLDQLKLERLQAALTRISKNVPFYRKKFEELGIDPYDFDSLNDVSRLPLTTKSDLAGHAPYGLFAVPLREVVRLHGTYGLKGKSVVVGYTINDIHRWSGLAARVLMAAGVTKDDVIQVAFNYGLSTSGFGIHYGAEEMGAAVVPASSGNVNRQISIIQDYNVTTLVCIPSYALYLADRLEELGININALALRTGLFGEEAWSEKTRAEIQDRLKITAVDSYGLSEVMGPGIAGECLERNGMHINEDHFLAEVIDPRTLEPVLPGQTGELVITTLTKEALPLVRFRTGDLTRLIHDPCPCGRTFVRMQRIQGRCDDMLIIQGINVFPEQVSLILSETGDRIPNYQIVLEREGRLDKATVLVEADVLVPDKIKEQQRFIERVKQRLAMDLGVFFEVRLVELKSMQFEDDRIVPVVDKRKF